MEILHRGGGFLREETAFGLSKKLSNGNFVYLKDEMKVSRSRKDCSSSSDSSSALCLSGHPSKDVSKLSRSRRCSSSSIYFSNTRGLGV